MNNEQFSTATFNGGFDLHFTPIGATVAILTECSSCLDHRIQKLTFPSERRSPKPGKR